MEWFHRGVRCRTGIAAVLAGASITLSTAAATEAANPIPGASYVGTFSGSGNISFGVSTDGRRVHNIRVRELPLTCNDGSRRTASVEDLFFAPDISPGGVFGATDFENPADKVEGRFGPSGSARGVLRLQFASRRSANGVCSSNARFAAEPEPRRPGLPSPVFTLLPRALDFARDGGPATASGVRARAAAELPDGSLIVVSPEVELRRIDPQGRIFKVRGLNGLGISGLNDVSAYPSGAYLFTSEDCVRRVSPGGSIATVAGYCTSNDPADTTFGGDGGPATQAELENPRAVAATADGGFLMVDGGPRAPRIRKVDPVGTITTVAGTGKRGVSPDGDALTSPLGNVSDIEALHDGGFLLAEPGTRRIRRVTAEGRLLTVAGTGSPGFAGDGGPATSALLGRPTGVLAVPGGGFLIGDTGNGRIRSVSRAGRIQTIAGGGEARDGARADRTALSAPGRLTRTRSGSILFADHTALRAITTRKEKRLLVGLPPRLPDLRSLVRRGRAIPVVLTRSSTVTFEVRRLGRVVVRVTRRLPGGRSRVRLGRSYPRGFPPSGFSLRVIARAGQRIATTGVNLNPAPDFSEDLPR